jgi:hypothetical protein
MKPQIKAGNKLKDLINPKKKKTAQSRSHAANYP